MTPSKSNHRNPADKICPTVAVLNTRLERNARLSVVFTNGVFDILHPGHVQLLAFSQQQGDILVVGVNDDASVRRLKGDQRPIFPLSERMEILAALEYVDYIVPFAEDTPLELIQSMDRIDTLVKGGDYNPDQVVGREWVEKRGGRLLLFPLDNAHSSTSIIDKILSG